MSRKPRTRSATGIYHIILRGADRRILFSDATDCNRFLDTISKVKQASDFSLYAYCLMGNHVHLLLKENLEPIEQIMKRIEVSYVHYYNWKYQLHGHLFQDRFRSEAVECDAYFLDVLRYICQNPVKAGLCRDFMQYRWVGCVSITGKQDLLDPAEAYLSCSKQDLTRFIREPFEQEHLEDKGETRLTDQEAIKRLCEVCQCEYVQEIGGWDKDAMEKAVLSGIKTGISIRQLSRITAISKTRIERIIKR